MQDLLAEAFDRNRRIVRAQCDGLTHEDSLIQTPYHINCLNWVVGHIVDSRLRLLRLLGEEAPPLLRQISRYRRESEPITRDGADVIALETLLEALDASQERLGAVLNRLGPADLAEVMEIDGRASALGARIHFLYFHDTYHTGQTELLRQVAGTDDKII